MALIKKRRLKLNLARFPFRKGLSLLPNLFTLGNAFFGFCSIIFTAYGDYVAAAHFILLGALMDALDGRIARLIRVTSELGMQLDSLCDTISFGLAPALLVYMWQLNKVGGFGLFVCALFLMAGLLRLARFNVTHAQQSNEFMGTPITIAGCFLATILLNTHTTIFTPKLIALLFALVMMLSFLMVSKIPFPAFKKISKNFFALAIFCSIAFIVTMGLTRLTLIIFIGYYLLAFEELIRHKLQNFYS